MSGLAIVAVVLAIVVVMVAALAVAVLRLRRQVAQFQKGREVVDRHIGHIYWRLDGEPRNSDPDQHLVFRVREREPDQQQ